MTCDTVGVVSEVQSCWICPGKSGENPPQGPFSLNGRCRGFGNPNPRQRRFKVHGRCRGSRTTDSGGAN